MFRAFDKDLYDIRITLYTCGNSYNQQSSHVVALIGIDGL